MVTIKIYVTGNANHVISVSIGNTKWSDTLNYFQTSLDELGKSSIEKEKIWIKEDTKKMLLESPVADRYEALTDEDKEIVLEIMLNKGAIPYDMIKNRS